MKATTRKHSAERTAKRTIATLLAIMSLASVSATFASSITASADEVGTFTDIENQDWSSEENSATFASSITASVADVSTFTDIENQDWSSEENKVLMEAAQKIGKQLLDKGLDEVLKNIPFADALGVKEQVLDLLGLASEEVTADDLAKKLDKLEETMLNAFDEQTKKLIAAMEDANVAGTYKRDLKNLADTNTIITTIQGSETVHTLYNYSDEDKLVKLAMVAGNLSSWTNDGSFIKGITAVTSDLLGKNYVDDRDIFNVLYDTKKENYQFSGEVIDAIKPYISKMIIDYYKNVAIAVASLNAQEQILYGDFDASKITSQSIRKQYESLFNDIGTIEEMKYQLMRSVYGTDAFKECGINIKTPDKSFDTVTDHYNDFLKKDRSVHIPTGKVFNKGLPTCDSSHLIGDSYGSSRDFGEGHKEETNKNAFKKRMTGEDRNGGLYTSLTADEIEKLAAHMQSVIAEKKQTNPNYTGVDYLRDSGFDVTGITPDYYIPTGKGYQEKNYSWSLDSSRWDAYFDAINLRTGKIENIEWKDMQNNTGLVDLINGNKARFTDHKFLFLRAQNDQVISYRAHVANDGWHQYRLSDEAHTKQAGTTKQSKQMEGIVINYEDLKGNSQITYRVNVAGKGWMDWVSSGELAGTTGENRQIEAIEIKLTGEAAEKYDVVYRVHMASKCWGKWVKNGQMAGTTGENRRIEAIEIKLVKK